VSTKLDSFEFKSTTTTTITIDKGDRIVTYVNGVHVSTEIKDENNVTEYDLTHSYVSTKKSGKKGHYHRPWRGEDQTRNDIKAVFQKNPQATTVPFDERELTRDIFKNIVVDRTPEAYKSAARIKDADIRSKEV
jgi:hypothetical protein